MCSSTNFSYSSHGHPQAYKNFGNRVKSLHTKLLEKAKTLPEGSPVPSPSIDAPSPENSDDEELSLPDSGSSGKLGGRL